MAGAHVLVVDDDAALAQLVAEIVADQGHQPICVASGEAALAQLEAASIDLLLCDVRMPGIDGIELIARAEARDPSLAIIAMTAFGSLDTALRAVRAGADDYLVKPFDPGDLQLRVEMALARRAMAIELRELRRQRDEAAVVGMVGRSAPMRELTALVRRVADTTSTVLVSGPSGSGKELVARALHQESRRRDAPFVAVNCAAIPAALVEAELFGAKKGAYTDARADRPGMFQAAHGGTIFLDEIGELPLAMQAKLLRVLQEREVRAVGATSVEHIDVRVVAATNRDLRSALVDKTFREDLFYRLAVIEIVVPPLRDRPADIVPLAEHFLARAAGAGEGRTVSGLSKAAARLLLGYPWPGNVRELQSAIERAVALCDGPWIGPDDLPAVLRSGAARGEMLEGVAERGLTLPELERAYARMVLARAGGNKVRAAQLLGVDRRTLQRWFGDGDGEGDG
jgi:DNA-binding NtrC family response regulator